MHGTNMKITYCMPSGQDNFLDFQNILFPNKIKFIAITPDRI